MVVTCTCTALYGIDSDTDSNLLNHSKLLLCYVMLSYVILLYCIVLYCIVLYCYVILCLVMLFCVIVLYCIALHCIALYCIVLYCIVLVHFYSASYSLGLSEALPTTAIVIVSVFTRRSAIGNCK